MKAVAEYQTPTGRRRVHALCAPHGVSAEVLQSPNRYPFFQLTPLAP